MKELYIDAHEELIAEYMDEHPDADEGNVYDMTADAAYARMTDKYAGMADHYRQMKKDGMI
jgi:hypothetical protein